MIIYKATCKTSGKCYIGKTVKSLPNRITKHLKQVRRGTSTKLYNAIRKYGISDFVWEIIDSTDTKEKLDELEKHYINSEDTFKNGYNMTLGGDGGDTISSKSILEKKRQGAKIGNIPWNKGLNMKSMGYSFNNRKGSRKKFTEEQKRNHSIKIKSSEKYRKGILNRKPAKQIIITDSSGKIWNTQKEWIKEFGLSYWEAKQILSGIPLNGIIYTATRIK